MEVDEIEEKLVNGNLLEECGIDFLDLKECGVEGCISVPAVLWNRKSGPDVQVIKAQHVYLSSK